MVQQHVGERQSVIVTAVNNRRIKHLGLEFVAGAVSHLVGDFGYRSVDLIVVTRSNLSCSVNDLFHTEGINRVAARKSRQVYPLNFYSGIQVVRLLTYVMM
ncbi:hypothetical protein D3C87_1848150 [compost metagenome]